MAEDDEEKNRFHTEEGLYCFTHMPKELKNLVTTLQRVMEKVLADQGGRNVEIYLEEIVIKSISEQDLVQDIKEMLRKLKRVNIKIDPITSLFGVKEGRFLGHMVTMEGARADPEKVQEIILSPTLKRRNKQEESFTHKKGTDLETAQTNTTAKLPLLKQQNVNSFKPTTTTTTNADGSSTTLIPGPVTADEKTQKKNDVK
ncbi:hypothetical protein Tco_1053255, partial [Tanacetum coccineum]